MPMTEEKAFRGPLHAALAGQAGVAEDALTAALRGLLRSPEEALPVPPADGWRGIPVDHAAVAALRERASAELGSPWPQPLAHDAARFHGDGDRVAWESAAFARQERLSRVAVLAAATHDDRWLDEAVDGAVLLCEQSSWCWPAHDDALARLGSVLAVVSDPYLDLGAGEVAGQLAWLDHLLGARLDERYPGVRDRLRHEVRIRVLEPFLRRRDWAWLGLDGEVNNWNPWIHGNVLVAALRLLDRETEREERARIVALAVEGMDRYVAALPPDGAIDEGYAYWWNGACRLLEALDVLSHATGGLLDPVPLIPALRETVAFPHRMHLGEGWFVNVADAQARPRAGQPWHALHRAAVRAGDSAARSFAAAHRREGAPAATEQEGLGRLLRGITDAAWLGAGAGADPLPAEVWLPSVQLLLARQEAGSSRGLTLVGKGGHNGESHNHNDLGSVIVASDGVPVIVDAGRPTYDARTFGPDRYSLWPMRSEWHGVPFVRGRGQLPGAGHAAEVIAVERGDDATALALELAGAYGDPGLSSWRREIRLDRPAGVAVVRDSWRLDPEPAGEGPTGTERPVGARQAMLAEERGGGSDAPAEPTQVRLLAAGEVTLVPGGATIQPLDDAAPLSLAWDPAAGATLTRRELDDPLLAEVWGEALTRIDIDVTDLSAFALTVRQAGMRQDESTTSLEER
jgi:hypothetical protein